MAPERKIFILDTNVVLDYCASGTDIAAFLHLRQITGAEEAPHPDPINNASARAASGIDFLLVIV